MLPAQSVKHHPVESIRGMTRPAGKGQCFSHLASGRAEFFSRKQRLQPRSVPRRDDSRIPDQAEQESAGFIQLPELRAHRSRHEKHPGPIGKERQARERHALVPCLEVTLHVEIQSVPGTKEPG